MEGLRNPWHETRFVPVPPQTPVVVEVTNHTGRYKLPFNVVFKGGKLLHGVKLTPLDPKLTVVRWRKAPATSE